MAGYLGGWLGRWVGDWLGPAAEAIVDTSIHAIRRGVRAVTSRGASPAVAISNERGPGATFARAAVTGRTSTQGLSAVTAGATVASRTGAEGIAPVRPGPSAPAVARRRPPWR